MSSKQRADLSTPVFAALFIGFAALVLWDTTGYTDADSYVFPRAVALALIVLSLLLLLRWLLTGWRTEAQGHAAGSTVRRTGLIVAMIAVALGMPYLGFLVSSVLAFGLIMLVAMYDPWTPFRLIVYPLAGIAIVLGFYFLFSHTLQVPLPVGTLFNG